MPPIAKDICVTGGYMGRFATHVKTECRPVEDPYKDIKVSPPGPCSVVPGIAESSPVAVGSHWKKDVMVSNRARNKTIMNPGNYCGGLKINDRVKLKPGLYYVTDGPLVFGKIANIKADDVTFILIGDKARLHMQEGAKADITASRRGPFGGIAFYQVPNNAKWPESQSVVRSGGDLAINGVFYFPSSQLHVQGTANVGAKAQATSFIAFTLKMDADVTTTINVDHKAAGIPPLEPRTDEGARLISNHREVKG